MNIGIDIGGTTTGIVALDNQNRVLYYKNTRTDNSYNINRIESSILDEIYRLLNDIGKDIGDIKSIGIAVPGVVSIDRRIAINCPNLGWYDSPFGGQISDSLDKVIPLFNDASSAAYGEYKLGELKKSNIGVMMTIGTGLGGGIIKSGNLYEGSHNMGSEFGHMIIGENHYNCSCGRNGCLETFVSATAIVKSYNYMGLKEGLDRKASSAKEIFELREEGDTLAIKVIDRFLNYLSLGILNISATIDPDMVVIGGGVSLAGQSYIEKLRRLVEQNRFFKNIDPPTVKISYMDQKAGAIGAAILAREYLADDC